MTRPVSTAITTAIALPVTSPGYLVQMGFSPILYASSRGTQTWNGQTWLPFGMKVSGLGSDGTIASTSGKLVFNDLDNVIGTLALGQSVGGTTVTVWAFYGDGALGASDPTEIFAGYGGDCAFDINAGTITFTLVQTNGRSTYIPRLYMTRENGFSFLPAPGTTIAWGNGKIVMQGE